MTPDELRRMARIETTLAELVFILATSPSLSGVPALGRERARAMLAELGAAIDVPEQEK